MTGYIIKGDTAIKITDKEAIEISKKMKMYPCDVCGKIFSWDEIRKTTLKDGEFIWHHPSCKVEKTE